LILFQKKQLRVGDIKKMQIREIDLSEKDKVDKFDGLAKEVGTIFNTFDWLKIFGNKIHLFGIYNKNKELVGGFYLFEERKFGLKILRNPYFTPHIGTFIKYPPQLKYVSKLSLDKEILQNIAEFIESLNYSIISFSLNRNIVDMQPFIWSKFKVIPGYTYVIPLKKGEGEIWKAFSAERRNDIRKALDDGIIVKQNFDMNIVKELVNVTFDRQGSRLKKKLNNYYLNKILFSFANSKRSFSFVSLKDDVPISVSFCVYDKNTAYYLLGGYDYKNKHHGAGALALWESIKYAQRLKLREFDFEGSMVPQIERYFRGFGGTLTPYYRVNKAKLPIEIMLKFVKREVF